MSTNRPFIKMGQVSICTPYNLFGWSKKVKRKKVERRDY